MCTRGSGLDARGMNVIEVTDLTKRYGDRAAVDGVSFSVEEGEIFGILGPNGAGKTTTVESIAGLRTPDAGTIRVLGLDPRKDRDRLRPLVGVQLQESELPDRMTVSEALDLFAAFYERPADPAGADRRPRPRGQARHRLSQPLGRPEAAPLDRPGPDRAAEDRDPRRAVDRPRPAGAAGDLAADRVDPRPRRHRPARHPPDGGGRAARRPRRGHRARAASSPSTRRPGIVSMVDAEQRLRFRPSAPIDDTLLTGLPEVRRVERSGPSVVVTGTGNLLQAVTSVLARHQIVANDLRIDQANLDDAYLALTSRLTAARTAKELS